MYHLKRLLFFFLTILVNINYLYSLQDSSNFNSINSKTFQQNDLLTSENKGNYNVERQKRQSGRGGRIIRPPVQRRPPQQRPQFQRIQQQRNAQRQQRAQELRRLEQQIRQLQQQLYQQKQRILERQRQERERRRKEAIERIRKEEERRRQTTTTTTTTTTTVKPEEEYYSGEYEEPNYEDYNQMGDDQSGSQEYDLEMDLKSQGDMRVAESFTEK
ncbi:Hypothetical protein SRAE_2000527800 [Strongyloides ratti]|uniref:Uncharacterized protein n=1 Tax=Strongyloides ratti TaxID=34506 RepID=A0A090N0G6_STRRB|nr:Hypothetical protein SRAE_2000527800 [Strongyloides ratti]CEF70653.1 Hypothetical protein SRAE_2000527800 [Strongyloides ratti]